MDASYLRHRKEMQGEEVKKDEPNLIKRKLPKGKDRTSTIYVQVPDDSGDQDQSIVMEEFVFNLDKLGRNYEYYFGHVKLQIFDYRKYQRMLRHINKDVIQKG